MKVTAYDMQGKKLAEDTLSAGKLLGKNQLNIQSVYNYAGSNEIIAIMKRESRTFQFDEYCNNWPQLEKGWPLYGYPNGYGLMQLDNPAAFEEQLWNWKSNIEGGKTLFDKKKQEVLKDFFKWKVPDNEPELNKYLLINSFHKYNTGQSRYKYLYNEKNGL